jgi:hypothetical protein
MIAHGISTALLISGMFLRWRLIFLAAGSIVGRVPTVLSIAVGLLHSSRLLRRGADAFLIFGTNIWLATVCLSSVHLRLGGLELFLSHRRRYFERPSTNLLSMVSMHCQILWCEEEQGRAYICCGLNS